LTDELRQQNGRIIGCTYVDNQWVFARGRHDREHPNGIIITINSAIIPNNNVAVKQLKNLGFVNIRTHFFLFVVSFG
jgi:hypothetical protein